MRQLVGRQADNKILCIVLILFPIEMMGWTYEFWLQVLFCLFRYYTRTMVRLALPFPTFEQNWKEKFEKTGIEYFFCFRSEFSCSISSADASLDKYLVTNTRNSSFFIISPFEWDRNTAYISKTTIIVITYYSLRELFYLMVLSAQFLKQ